MNANWPCLSFDVLRDDEGDQRQRFPASAYIVTGSQVDVAKKNELSVFKMMQLHKTQKDGRAPSALEFPAVYIVHSHYQRAMTTMTKITTTTTWMRTPSSTTALSSTKDESGRDEGQLRYWTADMCSRSPQQLAESSRMDVDDGANPAPMPSPNRYPREHEHENENRGGAIHRLMQSPVLYDPLCAPWYPIVLCRGTLAFARKAIFFLTQMHAYRDIWL